MLTLPRRFFKKKFLNVCIWRKAEDRGKIIKCESFSAFDRGEKRTIKLLLPPGKIFSSFIG
jgi:hypothetical protein